MLLQLPRLVAVPLITSVLDDIDSPAWMYPAILDVVTAVLAPFLAVALWKWRGLAVWTLTVAYLTMSIVDHGGAFVNLALVGEAIAFEDMTPAGTPAVAPAIQTVFDIVFLVLVTLPRNRRHFFTLAREEA